MTWSSGAVSFTQSPNRRSGFTLTKGSEVEQKSSHAARLSGRVVSVVSFLVNEWRRISRDHYDWSSGHCENLYLMKTLQWPAQCVHPGKKIRACLQCWVSTSHGFVLVSATDHDRLMTSWNCGVMKWWQHLWWLEGFTGTNSHLFPARAGCIIKPS